MKVKPSKVKWVVKFVQKQFNPPIQLGTGEWLFNCEAQNYKMGVFETLF